MANPIRKIKITLVGHYWDLIPEYSIRCNDVPICSKKKLPTKTGESYIEEFDAVNSDSFLIEIHFRNKTTDQSVLNLNRDKLVRDMLLEVRDFIIDDARITINDICEYHLKQSQMYQGKLVKNILGTSMLGFNGRLVIQYNPSPLQ